MPSRPPARRRLLLIASAALAAAGLAPAAARADVAFRASGSATNSGNAVTQLTLQLPRPAGLAVDDVMIAVVRWQHGNNPCGFQDPRTCQAYTDPAGWTRLDDSEASGASYGGSALWWTRATATQVGQSVFNFKRAWNTSRDTIASGVISAYSGVDTVSAFSWPSPVSASLQTQTTTSATVPFAAPPGTYEIGGMSVAAGTLAKYASSTPINVSSVTAGTLRSQAPVQNGGSAPSISSMIADRPAGGCGSYSTPHTTANLSIDAYSSAWDLVLTPASTFWMSSPMSLDYGTTTLTGLDVARPASAVYTVSDTRASEAGWSLSINATAFSTGTVTLPSTALSITGSSSVATAAGRCNAPATSIPSGPLVLTAGTPTKVYNATAGTGRGTSDITLNTSLAIPGNARVGAYTSTWTATIASGP